MTTANLESSYVPPKVELTQDHQNLCTSNLRFAKDLIPLVEDVKACGVDCSAYQALLDHLQMINSEIKTRFCTSRPLPGM